MEVRVKQVEFGGRRITRWMWTPGTPVMRCEDDLCGIDTETELIKNSYEIPHGVIAGFCSGSKCELVHWKDWEEYLPEFLKVNKDTKLVFFNLPFDVDVLGSKYFLPELERDGRMMEMGANYRIYKIKTKGWFFSGATLADITWEALKVKLEKEDGTRTSFTRDIEVFTDNQLDYLTFDCAATYRCGHAYNNMPTESDQARACYALAQTTRNGTLIDVPYVEKKRTEFSAKLLQFSDELRSFGFRPKQAVDSLSTVQLITDIAEAFKVKDDLVGLENLKKIPSGYLWYLASLLHHMIKTRVVLPSEIGEIIKETMSHAIAGTLDWTSKEGKRLVEKARTYLAEELDAIDASTCIRGIGGKQGKSTKPAVYIISILLKHYRAGLIGNGNMEAFNQEFYAEHEYFLGWLNNDQKPLSPDKFVQQHLRKMMADHPGLKFPLTDSAEKHVREYNDQCKKKGVPPDPAELDALAKYSFSSDDGWLLEDMGLTDPFLEKYAEYKHAQKMLSTYFTLSYVEGDGRNHSRYDYFKVTGRTGSSKPNAQNYPKEPGLREQVIPAPGCVLISCDYGQEEVVTLAATLKRRYKNSRMADAVNLGIDLHAYFSLFREGRLDDLDLTEFDPETVEIIKQRSKPYKEDPILKKSRALSKVYNFG